MQRIDGVLVLSPTDLNNFLDCEYLTRLDLEAADGRGVEKRRSAEADLLAAKGEAHERRHLQRFQQHGLAIVRIPDAGSVECGWRTAADLTRRAMAAAADVVYQGTFVSDVWRGRADFLIKTDRASELGAWSYEAWDTKLARHAKPAHVLQLAYYTEQLSAIQGTEPKWMHLVLGTDEPVRFRCREFLAYYRSVQSRFLHAIGGDDPGHEASAIRHASPYPVAHCTVCGYFDHCEDRWQAADHLCLVPNIRRSQVEALNEAGVRTCTELARSNGIPVSIGAASLTRLRQQARLQTCFRETGKHRFELLAPTPENGFLLLPPPSDGDIFFDMEGFPFFDANGGLEYLLGIVVLEDDAVRYRAFRATDRAGEKVAFEQFVGFVWQRLRRWPQLHIYHYSHYEPTALKRLTAFHATREEELDELLRREAFVDLYQVVRRSLRISHDSYSIKNVRQFFMPEAGKGDVSGGAESIVEFQRWLDTGDRRILQAIEDYNEEDCVSTLELRRWLLERRLEAMERFGVELPFRALPDRRNEPVETEPDAHADLRARLAATRQPWAPLLGHLLDYHRREAKPEWWAYFERAKKSLDDLMEDTEAIAYLKPTGAPPITVDRSLVYELEFPPQEFKLKVDADVEGPLGEGPVGSIEWIEAAVGRIGLRRGPKQQGRPVPTAIIAGRPIPDNAQRAAIERVGESVARGRSPYRAVADLVGRVPPRFTRPHSGRIQIPDLEAQKRLVANLDDSYLFIQGPPGSGKTWTGARLIVSLLAAGKRIGVTAPSHRAIHNLLDEVERVAADESVRFIGLKKRSTAAETAFNGRYTTSTESNGECEISNAQLIAGTAWLFARAGMDRKLDYLFIDEAGQTALADAVAVGTSTRNIVLLGDPQQLPHVTQNTHPEGSGASVLEHLLGDDETIAQDRGLFLATSRRMHPDICRFVSELSYACRLASAPGCERQQVFSSGLSGAGLRYLPVEHRHNSQESMEEARAIRRQIDRLLDGAATITDREGRIAPLMPADILVVAPYNMQVRSLTQILPPDIEVGTVDKFQGREAAVVFFSMASSSGDDVPRGLEFLFNRNRFNVAVSRAKCLSVLVCSPRLLEMHCRTVEQMRLVNAVCRFVESAGEKRYART